MSRKDHRSILLLTPLFGIVSFATLYIIASFGLLWYLLPGLFDWSSKRQKAIPYLGISSMLIAAFLFTRYHEEVINAGGLLGGIALALTFIELYKARYKNLLGLGLICLTLSAINYFIYETGILLFLLASMQKVTFLIFFTWAGWMNIALYKKSGIALSAKEQFCPPGVLCGSITAHEPYDHA